MTRATAKLWTRRLQARPPRPRAVRMARLLSAPWSISMGAPGPWCVATVAGSGHAPGLSPAECLAVAAAPVLGFPHLLIRDDGHTEVSRPRLPGADLCLRTGGPPGTTGGASVCSPGGGRGGGGALDVRTSPN